MRLLILVVISLAAAATIGLISLEQPGLMVVSYGNHSVELPLVLALLFIAVAFALLYLLFNFLFAMLQAPKKARAWNQARQNKKAQDDTLRGYARLIEGDWAHGEKDLLKRMPYCNTPMLNYLGAAYAAQQQQDFRRRDEYLSLAEGIDPRNKLAVNISRARMLTQAGQFEEAKALLGEMMHQRSSQNRTILKLKADVYQRTGDWEELEKLLPMLEKTGALPRDQVLALEVGMREAELNSVQPDVHSTPTIGRYHGLPRKRKKNPRVAAVYARKLIDEGELASAENLIRDAIKKNWDSELAYLYGKTRIENLSRQLSLAGTWLPDHEQDPNVNLTLARLNYAAGQIDKARVFYNRAIETGAGEEAYLELGQFYEDEGNLKTALVYYKRGVKASIRETGAPAATDLPQPGSLESVVTPGSTDIALPATGVEAAETPISESAAELIEDVEVIEHKPRS